MSKPREVNMLFYQYQNFPHWFYVAVWFATNWLLDVCNFPDAIFSTKMQPVKYQFKVNFSFLHYASLCIIASIWTNRISFVKIISNKKSFFFFLLEICRSKFVPHLVKDLIPNNGPCYKATTPWSKTLQSYVKYATRIWLYGLDCLITCASCR